MVGVTPRASTRDQRMREDIVELRPPPWCFCGAALPDFRPAPMGDRASDLATGHKGAICPHSCGPVQYATNAQTTVFSPSASDLGSCVLADGRPCACSAGSRPWEGETDSEERAPIFQARTTQPAKHCLKGGFLALLAYTCAQALRNWRHASGAGAYSHGTARVQWSPSQRRGLAQHAGSVMDLEGTYTSFYCNPCATVRR